MGCQQPKPVENPLFEFERIRYNLVRFEFRKKEDKTVGYGSGTIIDWNDNDELLILTCLHNLKPNPKDFQVKSEQFYQNIRIYFEEQAYSSNEKFTLLSDSTLDFALIKIKHRMINKIDKIGLFEVQNTDEKVSIFSWKKQQLDKLKQTPEFIGQSVAKLNPKLNYIWDYNIACIAGHSGSALFAVIDQAIKIVGVHIQKAQSTRQGIATKGDAWRVYKKALQQFNTPDNTLEIVKSITSYSLNFNNYKQNLSLFDVEKVLQTMTSGTIRQIAIGSINFNRLYQIFNKFKIFQNLKKLDLGTVLNRQEMDSLLYKAKELQSLVCFVNDFEMFSDIRLQHHLKQLKLRVKDSTGRLVSVRLNQDNRAIVRFWMAVFQIWKTFPKLDKIDLGCNVRGFDLHNPGCLQKQDGQVSETVQLKHKLCRLKIEQSDFQFVRGRGDPTRLKQIQDISSKLAGLGNQTVHCSCIT